MRQLRPQGLAARLLAAQVLVLVTMVLTVWLLAAAVGPSIFSDHLGTLSHSSSPADAEAHAERAFREASVISLATALAVALTVAVAVSAYVTRRIARPVEALAAAASDVASGHYEVAVPAPALGAEFDSLASSFRAMADELQHVEATRRRLLSDLAHEMRTPVATLDGYLEAFEDGVAALDGSTVAMLRQQTRRLTRLAEDMAAVSRAEEHQLPLDRRRADVAALVQDAVAAVAARYAERGVAVSVDVAPGLPEPEVDVDRLAQVLGNLLDNALRHTPPGGSVRVRATATHGEIALAVADTGSGIAPEHLPHVWERFYRVEAARDRTTGGSGIGLTIVKALVEGHGGRVTATSDGPGAGSTFVVQLPVGQRQAGALNV